VKTYVELSWKKGTSLIRRRKQNHKITGKYSPLLFLVFCSCKCDSCSLSEWVYQTHKLHSGESKVVPVLKEAPLHEGVLGEWRYSPTHSLTSVLNGGAWSASRPGCFNRRETAHGAHGIGGWGGGARTILDAVVKKFPAPAGIEL
jgi:hypothetical protein